MRLHFVFELPEGSWTNVCDRAFDLVNRKFGYKDVMTPAKIIGIIRVSASNSSCVSSTEVK